MALKPELYPGSPGPQPLDLDGRFGVTYEFVNQYPVSHGLLGNGTIEFTDAGMVDGARFLGDFPLSCSLAVWRVSG